MYQLPVVKLRFLSPEEIENFDVNSISDDSPTGYIWEVDLLYPPSLHFAHSAYPLCPEHVIVQQSMLSPTLEQMYDYVGTKHMPSTKLITNLNDVRAEWSSIPESNKDSLQMCSNMIINFNYTIISD